MNAGKKKILLIDDDQSVLEYLAVKLAYRYDVVSTADGRQAVTLARRERPDVILCDIDMPRISGGEVAAALSQQPDTKSIPLIYLTALVSPQETVELEGQVGGRPGVSKRATIGDLVTRIETSIGQGV